MIRVGATGLNTAFFCWLGLPLLSLKRASGIVQNPTLHKVGFLYFITLSPCLSISDVYSVKHRYIDLKHYRTAKPIILDTFTDFAIAVSSKFAMNKNFVITSESWRYKHSQCVSLNSLSLLLCLGLSLRLHFAFIFFLFEYWCMFLSPV